MMRFRTSAGLISRVLGILVVCLFLPLGSLLAATYYADPTNEVLCSVNPSPCCCAAPSGSPDPACGTSSAPYTCLSDAIARAASGDTVEARNGTYHECVDISSKQNLLVTAQTIGSPVIQFTATHPVCAYRIATWGDQDAVWIRDSTNATFRGFVVKNAPHQGVQFWGGTNSGNRVEYADITNNGHGVLFYTSADFLTGSTIRNNAGEGVAVGPGVTGTLLTGLTIEDNGGTGLVIYPGANSTSLTTNSTVRNNGGPGISLQGDDCTIWNTTVTGNGEDGIVISGSNNDILGGVVADNAGYGIILTQIPYGSPPTPTGNLIDTLDIHGNYQGLKLDVALTTSISGCRIHHNIGNGILETQFAEQSLIVNNEIDNNGMEADDAHGMYMGGLSSIIRGNKVHHNEWYGIHLWAAPWGTASMPYIVERNEVYGNKDGMVLGGDTPPLRSLPQYTEIRYNLIHHNTASGFFYELGTCSGTANVGNSFHHNTLYKNGLQGPGPQVLILNAVTGQFTMRNNIIIGTGTYLLEGHQSNLPQDAFDGNLFFKPGWNGTDPLIWWNGWSYSLAAVQSPGIRQDNDCTQAEETDPKTPMETHSAYSSTLEFVDPSMNLWSDDPLGYAPYQGNYHLKSLAGSITGVCCPGFGAATDIDNENPFCSPADCTSPGDGVGADYFKDTDSDGTTDRYDCAPSNGLDASICEGDAYTSSQEAVCSGTSPYSPYDRFTYPTATQICDGKDNICDGVLTTEPDLDSDGYFTGSVCASNPALFDCNDSNPRVYPGAVEVCDTVNNNCLDSQYPTPRSYDVDNDLDGAFPLCGACFRRDCDDNNPAILWAPDCDSDGIENCAGDNCLFTANPGQENCDGDAEGDACDTDDDNDGSPDTLDCEDCNPAARPGLPEDCSDPVDNDCNGVPDTSEPACQATVAATNTTNGSTAATNKVCNLPTGIASGNLLLLVLRSAGNETHSTPSGWSQLVLNNTSDGSDDRTSLWYKKATGTEGSTVTVNGTASLKFSCLSWRITGAADPTIQPPQVSTVATGKSTAPNPASLAPTGGTKLYLWLWLGGWEGEQTSPPASNPANYSSNKIGANSGTAGATATNCRLASATRNLNASSEDPGTWTISASDDWTAYTVAVHP